MMEPVARLRIRIEVLSPVHVGTGEELGPKSCVPQRGKLHVIDEQKLLDAVGRSHRVRESFLRFCESPRAGLRDFLRDHRIPVEEVRAYTIDLMGGAPRKLLPFIKAAGSPPRPYLPGSSLKGALRSALFRSALLDDVGLRRAAADRVWESVRARRKPKYPGQLAEEVFFGPDQHHDLMRMLQVADSNPLPPSRLQVAEVRTLSSTRQRTLRELRFQIYPEVLPAGLRLRGEVIFKAYLFSELAREKGLDFGGEETRHRLLDFVAESNRAARNLIEQEITFFERYGARDLLAFYENLRRELNDLDKMACLVRLGWGTGFDDKAVTDVFDERLFDEVREAYRLGVGRPGRRGRGLRKALSPKSRKAAFRSDGPPQPLGWIKVRL
jgi:CRISPR-associated protein Csm5